MKERRLLAYYDLRCAPVTFDFAVYLSGLVGYARLNGYEKISLCIYAPFYRKSNPIERGYSKGYEDRKARNVLLGVAGIAPMIDDIIFTKSGMAPLSKHIYPPGYNPSNPALAGGSPVSLMPCTPVAIEDIYQGKGNPRIFHATERGMEWVHNRFPALERTLTISLRNTQHIAQRNCALSEFVELWKKLTEAYPDYRIVVIPDQDDLLANYEASRFDWELCPEAALDHELRLTLYETAAFNIAWNSGPAIFLLLSDAKYIVFGFWNEANHLSSRAMFDRKGPRFGAQLPWALPDVQFIDWTASNKTDSAHMFEQTKGMLEKLEK